MDLRLVYGFLVGMAIFIAIWFLFVAPSERRDHERRLRMVRKRIAEREERLAAAEADEGTEDDGKHDERRGD